MNKTNPLPSVAILLLSIVLGLVGAGGAIARTSQTANDAMAIQIQPGAGQDIPATAAITTTASTLSIGPASVSGSSLGGDDCYAAGNTRVMCFSIHNGSPDAEWLSQVRLTFPTLDGAWEVACHTQDAADSSGSPVNMACNASGNEIVFTDNDVETPDNIGELSAGSSWGFCASVTVPGAYTGDRIVNWGILGDGDGAPPHDETGILSVEQCLPLMIKPSTLQVQGCNGITQTLTFELWNDTGSNGTFALSYEVTSGNGTFSGPDSLVLSDGEIVTWTASLVPDKCLSVGDVVAAALSVSGNGRQDTSLVTHTALAFAGWQGQTVSPVPAMDNVVIWASHADGGLWSIGGYGSMGATQRYDPQTNQWTTHTPETVITPTIEYPMDGCYGLNDQGHEVVVLFPDTIVTGTLHVYDITTDIWSEQPIPTGYPAEGRWGHDVVSLLNVPGINQNTCYLSGGSTEVGGGRTRDLWRYDPETNVTVYLGLFPASIWFGFHASWHVPWIGQEGAICVGGGIDHNSKSDVAASTQCYDLATGQFRAENADLGPLPEPWWGMADGWRTYNGRYQIWLANGVAQNGALIQASAYADETTGGFVYGPRPTVALYRLEGTGWNGQFFVEQGAAGGFQYTYHNHLLVQCPICARSYLPTVLNDYTSPATP
ncbi:MAG: hypothetical protein JXA89_22680 [Anaerolineae bacterium]|nr:hypothetical protein [Anaerolineae bacterium]